MRSATPPPRRMAPRGLTLRAGPARDRRRPFVFTVSGRLALPAGVSRAAGCRGRAAVRIGRTSRVARLRRDCGFRVRVRLPRSQRPARLRLRVTFMGNAALAPRSARPLTVRAG